LTSTGCRRYFHEEFTDPLLVAINEYRQTGQPAAAAASSNVAVTYSNRWLDRLTRLWLGGSIRDIENFESTVATRSTGEALQYRDVPSEATSSSAAPMEVMAQQLIDFFDSLIPVIHYVSSFFTRIPLWLQTMFYPPESGSLAKPRVPSLTQSEVHRDRRGDGSISGAIYGVNRAQFSDTMTV
jgi:hypothetical protein